MRANSLVDLTAAFRDLENNPPLEFYRVTICNQLAIYNGVVLTWKEKVSDHCFVQ